MFDIGWTEMLVIAVVMIVVVGPKDLPRMLRTFGKTTAKMRSMAGDFQRQFNEAMREAELDEVKKSVDDLRSLNPANEIRKQLNPLGQAAADIRAGIQNTLNTAAKPDTSAAPAAATAHPAEPLKTGPSDMPGAAAETPAAPPLVPMAEPLPAAASTELKPAEPAVAAKPKRASKPRAAAPKTVDAKPEAAKTSVAKIRAPKAAAVAAAKPRTRKKTGDEA